MYLDPEKHASELIRGWHVVKYNGSNIRHGARDDFAVIPSNRWYQWWAFLHASKYRFVLKKQLLSTTRDWDKSSNDKRNKQEKKIEMKVNLKTFSWLVHKISSQILRTPRQTRKRQVSPKKSDKGSLSCLKRASLIHFVIFIPRKRSSIHFGRIWATLVLKMLAGMFKYFVCSSVLHV